MNGGEFPFEKDGTSVYGVHDCRNAVSRAKLTRLIVEHQIVRH